MRALSFYVKENRREHIKFKSFPEGMMLCIIWSFTFWLLVQYIDAVQCSAQSQVSVHDYIDAVQCSAQSQVSVPDYSV